MRFKPKYMDMTNGVPWRVILLFSVPIVFGNILQELYALIDSLIVSRFIGLNAVAAIGGTAPVRMMFTRICMDCSMAFGIAAANRVGADNKDELKRVVAVGMRFGFGLGIVLLVLMLPSLDFVLHLLQIADNIYDDAKLYFLFSVLQIPLCIAYNMSCAFLRAAGDSNTPFFAILFSSILNILLDLLFVVVFPFGILGAALATFAAQLLSALIAFLAVFHHEPYRTKPVHWSNNRAIAIETSKLWIPMFANSICISVGMFIAHRPINAAGGLICATILSCIGVIMIFPDQYLGMAIPGQMYADEYKKYGLCNADLGNMIGAGAAVTSPLVPWSTCGAYMTLILEVNTVSYAPYAIFSYLLPISVILYGFIHKKGTAAPM